MTLFGSSLTVAAGRLGFLSPGLGVRARVGDGDGPLPKPPTPFFLGPLGFTSGGRRYFYFPARGRYRVVAGVVAAARRDSADDAYALPGVSAARSERNQLRLTKIS